jgi:CHAT domain-containing protein
MIWTCRWLTLDHSIRRIAFTTPLTSLAELMKLFYQRMLKDGMPEGTALRAAQLELSGQKRWASHYFWAGFVLHGEWK